MTQARYENSIFLNVPFDEPYRPILEALIFAIYECGFVARSALESDDATQVRIEKIFELIAESKYSIHDISRTELDQSSRLPRFNMPLELGIFLGAKRFGDQRQRSKRGLILDRQRYRFQKFCSDIAGQDIRAHRGQPSRAIRCVREWLRASPETKGEKIPSAKYIAARYQTFRRTMPSLCERLSLDVRDLNFVDFTYLVRGWMKIDRGESTSEA